MAEETVPYEREIAELTIAAKRAAAMLEKQGREAEAIEAYRRVRDASLKDCFNPHTDISDPKLPQSVGEAGQAKLFTLVSGLLRAHLDIYAAATERSTGANIRPLAEFIRVPALGVIQAGYLFMATCMIAEQIAHHQELEAMLRKGEANPASRDMYVSQAMDLLRMEMDCVRPRAASPERKGMPERKTRVR